MKGKKEQPGGSYLKIQRHNGSAVLSISQFVPKDWRLVQVILEDSLDTPARTWVRLRIERVV